MNFLEFLNLQCLSDAGVSKNIHKMCKEFGMHGSESNLEEIFNGKREGKSSFRWPIWKWELIL